MSACNSGKIGQTFIDAGVKHVCCVDVDTKLLDKDAREFADQFYRSIFHDVTILQAFNVAHQSLDIRGDKRSKKFLLLPIGADHDKKVFEGVPAARGLRGPKVSIEDDTVSPPSFPKICKHFLGRNVDMSRVLKAILNAAQPVVILTGPPKSGKTAFAVALSRYIWERRRFIGGESPYYVHFIDLKGHTTIISAAREMLEIVRSDIMAAPSLTRLQTKVPVLSPADTARSSSGQQTAAMIKELNKVLCAVSKLHGEHHVLLVGVLLQGCCLDCLCARKHPNSVTAVPCVGHDRCWTTAMT